MPKKYIALYQMQTEKSEFGTERKTKSLSGLPMQFPQKGVKFFIVNIFNTYLMMLCCLQVVLIAAENMNAAEKK